jgi:hypothetical protein
MLTSVVNSNKKHTNNPLTSVWGKTIKATNNNNGCPSNNNQPKLKLMKAIKNTVDLLTQFGVNEPNLGGGQPSPFHYQ